MKNRILTLPKNRKNQVAAILENELKLRKFRKTAPLQVELSRRYLWYYLLYTAPEFFKEDREYQKDISFILQGALEGRIKEFIDNGFISDKSEIFDGIKDGLFYIKGGEYVNLDVLSDNDRIDKVIINLPPRHGKSFILKKMSSWVLGNNIRNKIISAAYNEEFSVEFSEEVKEFIIEGRDLDDEEKSDINRIFFSDIFPDVHLKYGDNKKQKWSLEGGNKNFRSVSPGTAITGAGSNIKIIDDMVKDAEEAFNYKALDKTYNWFTSTLASRVDKVEGGVEMMFIVGTRWSPDDITGRVLSGDIKNENIILYSRPAVDKNGNMLCNDVLDKLQYKQRTANMVPEIREANYNQKIISTDNKLYNYLYTYDYSKIFDIPLEYYTYTDPADKGDDYIAHILFGVDRENQKAYIIDVIYNDQPVKVNQDRIAAQLLKYPVLWAYVEDNGVGSLFSDMISSRMVEMNRAANTNIFIDFHQNKNKEGRIYTNAEYCKNNILLPDNYLEDVEMKEFVDELINYNRKGGNRRDDGTDAFTGVGEMMIRSEYGDIPGIGLGIEAKHPDATIEELSDLVNGVIRI